MQSIEVINLARDNHIPLIVAINKIDRPGADPSQVHIDLTAHEVFVKDIGGDVIAVPISAKNLTNLDLLEQEIVNLSESLKL